MSPPTRLELDEMLTGGGDDAAWLRLLGAPDAVELWQSAQARRRSIDELSAAVAGRAWLARTLRRIRSIQRLNSQPEGVALRLGAPVLTAALRSSQRRQRGLEWGALEIRRVPLGAQLRWSSVPDTTVWYQQAGREGRARRGWKLEAGDSAVLIVVLAASEATTLSEALDTARRASTIVILEEKITG